MHFLTDFLTTIKQLSSLETITEYSVVLSSSTKIWGGWWRWARVSLDGVAPSRMVCVSASVILPLHHKVQKFSSGTGSPGWPRKKGRKKVVVYVVVLP